MDNNLMKEADKIMKILDDLHDNNPEEYDSFIKKTLKEGRSECEPPQFRFSIHAFDVKTKTKHFINVCGFPPIPAPKTDNDPISVFGGKSISTEINNQNVVIECLGVNPKVLDEIGDDKSLKKMLIKLAIDYYNDVNGYKLSYDCGLSKKQVGSDFEIHAAFNKKSESVPGSEPVNNPGIQIPKAGDNKIEESVNPDIVIGTQKPCKVQGNLISEVDKRPSKINFETTFTEGPCPKLKFSAKVDFIDSVRDLELEIVDDELILTNDFYSETKVKIPKYDKVDVDSVKAKLNKSKVLTITFNIEN